MAWTSTRNPSGPHHDSNPLFVVHRSQRSSTRARYVRSRTTLAGAAMEAPADARGRDMSLMTSLLSRRSAAPALRFQRGPDRVEAALQEAAVLREPLLELAKRL